MSVGWALLAARGGESFSQDIDLFHDTEEALAATFATSICRAAAQRARLVAA